MVKRNHRTNKHPRNIQGNVFKKHFFHKFYRILSQNQTKRSKFNLQLFKFNLNNKIE